MRVLLSRDIDGAAGDVYYLEMAGISSETKPTANVATGSKFYEVDTDTNYVYDEDSGDWTEAPSVVDDVNDLKNAINGKPDILDSDAEDVDLDFTDEDGNVIMRLEGGHIKTKEFDSSEGGNGDASIKSTDAVNVDLDLTDSSGNVILRMKDGHIKTKRFDSTVVGGLLESPEGTAGQVLGLNSNLEPEWQNAKTPLDLFIDNIDVDYRFDATSNANYTVIRVYKNTIHGGKQYPFVFAPNGAEAAGSRNKSTYEMNTEYGFVLALNAGIFDQSNGKPDGVLIMNGESFQTGASTTHSQCKPLWIDEDGDLHSSAYDTSSADLISQGCVSAVCGFMPIIVDYDPVPSSEWNDVSHYYDNAQRQIIGQFGNGDYAIVTCEGRNYQNSDGWTIAEAQTVCQEIGLKFAYNLDGGGSTELMLGMKHVNTIYDGTYGRKVPTFIVFNGTAIPPTIPTA